MPVKKTSAKAISAKTVAKAAPKVKTVQKATSKTGLLSVPVYSLLGVKTSDFMLPKKIFGAQVNEKLLAQALRIYANNEKGHYSNTKTRGEVRGSTRKIFKQKGTGRARHGSIRANIFVGGGIALGPKSRNTILDLPKKMKKAALISALSQKVKDAQIGIASLEKASGKTKELALMVKKLNKKSILFVSEKNEQTQRALRNIPKVDIISPQQLNTYELIKFQQVILTKEAVKILEGRLSKGAQ